MALEGGHTSEGYKSSNFTVTLPLNLTDSQERRKEKEEETMLER